MKPQRIRLSRKKGFNLQKASMELNGLPAVNCARPSKWGNPYKVGRGPGLVDTHADAKLAFFNYTWRTENGIGLVNQAEVELRGKNLACFCHIWQCPKCKRYADQWPDSPGPTCACGLGNTKNESAYTTMTRVPCHADVLLELANK